MKRKLAFLVLMITVMSTALVACGDDTTNNPAAPKAATVGATTDANNTTPNGTTAASGGINLSGLGAKTSGTTAATTTQAGSKSGSTGNNAPPSQANGTPSAAKPGVTTAAATPGSSSGGIFGNPPTVDPNQPVQGTVPAPVNKPGSTTSLPAYPGATKIQSFGGNAFMNGDGALDAFKTNDAADNIQAFYKDALVKAGYQEQKELAQVYNSVLNNKGTVLGYKKGNQAVVVVIATGADMAVFGATGLSDKDTIIMVTQATV